MTPSTKRTHAPWFKRVLIPIWVIQFLATFFVAFVTLGNLHYASHSGGPGYHFHRQYSTMIAVWAILSVLDIGIFIVVVAQIVQFARFRLTTKIFQWEISSIVAAQGVAVILAAASGWGLICAIAFGVEMAFSIGLLVHVVIVRKRVLRGLVTEMSKPVKDVAEDGTYIPLDKRTGTPIAPV